MATYKIPQNVEAEDKLIGPFTFKQFIFLMITAFLIFMAWLLARISTFLVLIPAPFILVFGILGVYRRPDQPVETFFLAALNFILRPKKRVWNSEGSVESVRLLAPKKQAAPKLKKLGEKEESQLQRLAHIVDTRGWYAKRSEVNEQFEADPLSDEDRLVSPHALQTSRLPDTDIHHADDLFDTYNNADNERLGRMAEQSEQNTKAQAIAKMHLQAPAVPAAAGAAPVNSQTPDGILELSNNNQMKVSELASEAQRRSLPEGDEINIQDASSQQSQSG
jgi:hypothetical protein